MLKTKVEVAEEIHSKILERIIYHELDVILYKQQLDKAKHGSKEKIGLMQGYEKLKQQMEADERLLLYTKQKITMYQNDANFKKEIK